MNDPESLSDVVSESVNGTSLPRRYVERIAARLLARWGRRYVALAGAGLVLSLVAVFLPSVSPESGLGLGVPLGSSAVMAPGNGGGAGTGVGGMAAGTGGVSGTATMAPIALSADAFGTPPSAAPGAITAPTDGSTAPTGGNGGSGFDFGTPTSTGTGVPTPPASAIPPCPLPLPSAKVPPTSLGTILSALGPILTVAGPFVTTILSVIPIVSPLLPVIGPLLGAIAPYEGPFNTVADALAPILAPLENALLPLVQAVAPPLLSALGTALTPLVTAVADTSIMGCVAVVIGDLAAAIPPPSGSSGSSGSSGGTAGMLASLAGGAAGTASPHVAGATAPVVVQQVPWSSGLSTADRAAVSTLAAQNVPVMLNLLDVPPAGSSSSGPGFAQWVKGMVQSLPQVSIWQIGAAPSGASPPGTDASVVSALQAAEQNRRVGQFVGVGVAGTEANGPVPLLTAAEGGLGRSLNFVGVDYTAPAGATPGNAAVGLHQMLAAVRQLVLPAAGVASTVPIFATAGYQGASPGAEAQALSAFSAAARGLGVGLLAWQAGSDVSTPVAALLTSPQARP